MYTPITREERKKLKLACYQERYRAMHREKMKVYQKAYQLVLHYREPKPLERGSIAYD